MKKVSLLIDETSSVVSHKIHEIAEIIYRKDFSENTAGLMYGNMGIALFLFHYSIWSEKEKYYKKATELLMHCFDTYKYSLWNIHKCEHCDYSFSDGISGFGWGLNHLISNNIIDGDICDIMNQVDPWIYRKMIYDIHDENFDVLKGASGIGNYCLSRDSRLAYEYLVRAISEIRNKKTDLMDKFGRTDSNYESIDISILLKQILLKYRDIDPIPELLADSNCCKQKTNTESSLYKKVYNHYLSFVLDNSNENRITQIKQSVNDLIKCEFKKSFFDYNLIHTVSLCNRVFQETNDQCFKGYAIQILQYILNSANYKDQDTEYKVWLSKSQGMLSIHYGLLNGLSGIGLVLLDSISDNEYQWI